MEEFVLLKRESRPEKQKNPLVKNLSRRGLVGLLA